ncbi:hypothetical protein D3C80_2206680 [compost metagenome]
MFCKPNPIPTPKAPIIMVTLSKGIPAAAIAAKKPSASIVKRRISPMLPNLDFRIFCPCDAPSI